MSTYFWVRCDDCASPNKDEETRRLSSTGHWSRSEAGIREAVKSLPELLALAATGAWDISSFETERGGYRLAHFLVAHAEHKLSLLSDQGETVTLKERKA